MRAVGPDHRLKPMRPIIAHQALIRELRLESAAGEITSLKRQCRTRPTPLAISNVPPRPANTSRISVWTGGATIARDAAWRCAPEVKPRAGDARRAIPPRVRR